MSEDASAYFGTAVTVTRDGGFTSFDFNNGRMFRIAGATRTEALWEAARWVKRCGVVFSRAA
jgi:hypothetical protein